MNVMYVNSQSSKKQGTPLGLFVLDDPKLTSSYSTDTYPSLVNHGRMNDNESFKAVTVQQVVQISTMLFKHPVLHSTHSLGTFKSKPHALVYSTEYNFLAKSSCKYQSMVVLAQTLFHRVLVSYINSQCIERG